MRSKQNHMCTNINSIVCCMYLEQSDNADSKDANGQQMAVKYRFHIYVFKKIYSFHPSASFYKMLINMCWFSHKQKHSYIYTNDF